MAKVDEVKLRIRTREERFILDDVAPVDALLRTHGQPIEYVVGRPETLITTIYVDTPEGTWSQGLTQTKLRVRSYQDPEQWWFELKRREGIRVDKWRRPVSVASVLGTLTGDDRWMQVRRVVGQSPLVPLFGAQCRRTAFEWTGLRVTVDRDLTFFAIDRESPLAVSRRIGHLAGVVVEVKREGEVPEWLDSALEGFRAKGYSKSRYALALRAGLDRPYLVADVSGRSSLVGSVR